MAELACNLNARAVHQLRPTGNREIPSPPILTGNLALPDSGQKDTDRGRD